MRALSLLVILMLVAGCSGNVRHSDGRSIDGDDLVWLQDRLAGELADRGGIVRAHSWAPTQILVRLDGEVVLISPLQAAIGAALLAQGATVHADAMPGDAGITVTLTATAGPSADDLRSTTYLAEAELRSAAGTVLDIIRLQIDKRWKPQPNRK